MPILVLIGWLVLSVLLFLREVKGHAAEAVKLRVALNSTLE